MNQTRFEVFQSTFVVVTQLRLEKAQYQIHGTQFTMTLLVKTGDDDESAILLDIYVDRTLNLGKAPDKTVRVATMASIDPDGERFEIEIELERGREAGVPQPKVIVSPDMFRLLAESQRRFEESTVEKLLEQLNP